MKTKINETDDEKQTDCEAISMGIDLSSYRVYRLVEFMQDRLEEDCFELMEIPVEHLLARYGLFGDLTLAEKEMLFTELLDIAEQKEFAEISRMVNWQIDHDCGEEFMAAFNC